MMCATIQGTQPITPRLFSQTKQEAGRLWNPCSIRTPCHFTHRPPTPSRGIFYWASEIPRVINMHTWERRKMSCTQMQSIRSLWAARKDSAHTYIGRMLDAAFRKEFDSDNAATWNSYRTKEMLGRCFPNTELSAARHSLPKLQKQSVP